MIIKLEYFGISILSSGTEAKEIELKEGCTINQLLYKIADKVEAPIDVLLNSATFLVNKAKADKDTVLEDGDEVLILKVLGGG